MADRVLILDHDETVLTMLYKVIKSNGMEADLLSDGQKALELIFQNAYSLILLDVELHDLDGFELIRKIRSQRNNVPIIIITGRSDDYDMLYGLDIGADDYIIKPFNPILLGAKVKALIRRNQSSLSGGELLTAGPFQYNTSTLRFYKNGIEIPLSAKENAIMKLFMDHVNRVFSKDMIYELIWGETLIDENAIMVYISRLRQKIEEDPGRPAYIQTVRGLGYRFVV